MLAERSSFVRGAGEGVREMWEEEGVGEQGGCCRVIELLWSTSD